MSNNRTHETTLCRLLGGEHLSAGETAALIGAIMDGTMPHAHAAETLLAFATKGEHPDEVHGAASAMRERALRVDHGLPLVMDVVGTGGDGAGTINISTTAALVVASAGVPVAKHGNRAASSKCGSADMLEATGLPLDTSPEIAATMLQEAGFTFLFAPRYHPAMKNVGPIRKELGIRTIFNLLGPLTNPAQATHYVVGVARPNFIELIADVLERHPYLKAAAIIHTPAIDATTSAGLDGTMSADSDAALGIGCDEISGTGPTTCVRLDVIPSGAQRSRGTTIIPAEFGVTARLDDLRGDSVEACAQAFRAILSGERSVRADVVALNAALALQVAGKVEMLREGYDLAREILASGEGLRTFEKAKAIATAAAVK